MNFDWRTALLTALISAAVAVIVAHINERSKEKRARDYRWDVAQYELSREFVAKARRLAHLCSRFDRALDEKAARATINDVHGDVRSAVQQLRILANSDCNKHARFVQRHLYAVRETKVEGNSDPRAAEYPNELPVDRYQKAMRDFLIATRTQLGVKAATDVPTDLGIDEGDPGNASQAQREEAG